MSNCLLNIYTWSAAITNATCIKLLKFQIFCPKFAPHFTVPCTSDSLPFFYPLKTLGGNPFFHILYQTSQERLVATQTISSTTFFACMTITSYRILNYPFQNMSDFVPFLFSHVEAQIQKTAYSVLMFCCPPLSDFYHLHISLLLCRHLRHVLI